MGINNLQAKQFDITKNGVYVNSVAKQPGMLFIWANWCPHCHEFLPTYKYICSSIGSEFTCAAIEHKELQAAPKLASALQFDGFPTIKFFDQNGKIIGTYDEPDRSKSSVLAYICKVYHHCIIYH
jgi:thiol-disulfide isomerase/thioredoxin